MEEVDALFRYEIPPTWIQATVGGGLYVHEASGMWIRFPGIGEENDATGPFGLRAIPATAGEPNSNDHGLAIRVVLVGVRLAGLWDLSGSEQEIQIRLGQSDAVTQMLNLEPTANNFLRTFLQHVRVDLLDLGMQNCGEWSGNPDHIFMVRRSDRSVLPCGTVIGHSGVRIGPRISLTPNGAARFLEKASADLLPPIWRRLYADARGAMVPSHAVVLCAMSCEIGIKDVLLNRANEQQRGFIELLLNNPREYSLAAASLYQDPSKLVLGESLTDLDGGATYKVVEALMSCRNAIVHHSKNLPTERRMLELVRGAEQVHQWLIRHSSA